MFGLHRVDTCPLQPAPRLGPTIRSERFSIALISPSSRFDPMLRHARSAQSGGLPRDDRMTHHALQACAHRDEDPRREPAQNKRGSVDFWAPNFVEFGQTSYDQAAFFA